MWLIAERLYLGDYRSGEEALAGALRPAAAGEPPAPFAGVVSLCPMPLLSDRASLAPMHPITEWLRIPILDGGNGEGEFEAALSVIRPFVRRRRQVGNVLIHCAAGMSRSVAVTAAILCDEGAGLDGAFSLICQAKALALRPFVGSPEDLIAPAAEFRQCLGRLYNLRTNRTGPQTDA